MNRFDAVLFDLDGTLLDTAPDLIASCNHTLEMFNLPPVEKELLMTKVTAGMREMLKLGIEPQKQALYDIDGKMRTTFANYYTEHINDYTRAFDGIEDLIGSLRDNSIKSAVVTNKYEHMALRLMSKFDFATDFELILGCDSTSHSKPHPEPLLKAMESIGVSPDKTLYVGDHLNDIKAARAAGCKSCVALWGYGPNECADPATWNSDYSACDVYALKELIFT